MAWIYLAESEDSLKPWKATSGQSPTVRSTDTLPAYSYHEWLMDQSLSLPYGTTLPRFGETCFIPLTSSTEVSPVRTFQSQDAEKAWKESEAAYSLRSSGSLAKYDPDSCSWKTCQRSLLGGLEPYLGKWPRWGMTVDGVFYPLQTWGQITDETDGGYWRTPDTGAGGTSGLLKEGKTHRKSGAAITVRLVDQVNNPRMWPTPLASDGEKMGHGNLDHTVRMWPTPTVQDAENNGGPSQYERNSLPLNAQVGGQLNPTWVEWLMGYRSGWTVLEDWATRWFRPKRGKRSSA